MVDHLFVEAWLKAADDLGIRVVAPFFLAAAERQSEVEAFLPDFGGSEGMVITTVDDQMSVSLSGKKCSRLGEVYRQYDRRLFVETLNDWGYFGAPAFKPAWFTGQAWT